MAQRAARELIPTGVFLILIIIYSHVTAVKSKLSYSARDARFPVIHETIKMRNSTASAGLMSIIN